MKKKTDLYNEALWRGAKPIIHIYLGSNVAIRCYGKETPQEAHLDSTLPVFSWEARVLSNGTATQTLSADSENIFLALREESMKTYVFTLDNTDYEISRIAGRELLLGGLVLLKQGFDYPGFTADDFIPLFSGIVQDIDTSHPQTVVKAVAVAKGEDPVTPTIDTSAVYIRFTPGTGTIAEESWTYAQTQPVFFGSDSYTIQIEGELSASPQQTIFFQILNDKFGSTRIEVGLNASGQPYLKVAPNIDTATPTYTQYDADFALAAGQFRLTVEVDATRGTVTISDRAGNRFVFSSSFVFQSVFGGANLGSPFGLAVDASNNIYIVDSSNNRIVKFDSAGNFLLNITHANLSIPADVAIGPSGNVWCTTNQFGIHFMEFSPTGTFLSSVGVSGLAADTFIALSLDSTGNIWGCFGRSTNAVFKVNQSGSVLATIPRGTGVGQITGSSGISTDSLDNVWVSDSSAGLVKHFTSAGIYINTIASPGSDDGQLSGPYDVHATAQFIYVADTGNNRINLYLPSGEFIESVGEFGSGDGQFQQPTGIGTTSIEGLVVADRTRGDGQIFSSDAIVDFDRTDTSPTSNNTIVVGENLSGGVTTVSFYPDTLDPTWMIANDNESATEFTDLIDGNNLPVIDGDWYETMQNEEITSPLPGEDLQEAASVSTVILLPTAETFEEPGLNQQNLLIPFPYGNLLENADSAVWIAPLINSIEHDYCVAGWPVQPVASGNTIRVYVDGVLTSSGWTFYDSFDYEGKGNIAYLHFSSDPGGTISVVCNGKWVDSTLLINPVDILADWIEFAAGLVGLSGWALHSPSFNEGRAYCEENGFVGAGVILANQTLAHWIKQMLASFLGSFQFNDNGEIQISFLPLEVIPNVQGELNENEHITLHAKQDAQNVLGQIVTNYAVAYVQYDKRFVNNSLMTWDRTQEDKGPIVISNSRTLEQNFEWNRNTASIVLIHQALLELYGYPPWIVPYQGQDFWYISLDVTDQIIATLKLVRGQDGEPIPDVLYEIRGLSSNLDTFDSSLTLQSIKIPVPQPVFIRRIPVFLEQEQVYLGKE